MCPKFNQSMCMCQEYANTPERAQMRWQRWLDGVGSSHVERYCMDSDSWREGCANYIDSSPPLQSSTSGGCYVATCVYGTYDCPEVWTLRRFRDNMLTNHKLGRYFIRLYYATSPKLVSWFGKKKIFTLALRPIVDSFVKKLWKHGVDNKPYSDR